MAEARLARFYGWTPPQINRLKLSEFVQYLNAIKPLQAMEMLGQLEASDYPYKKIEAKRKVFNKYKGMINSSLKKDSDDKLLTMDELKAQLRKGLQNG